MLANMVIISLFMYFLIFVFHDRISLCIPPAVLGSADQGGLELRSTSLCLPSAWDYRCVPLCLLISLSLSKKIYINI